MQCALSPRPTTVGPTPPENNAMLDTIMLAIGLGFFGLSVLYGQACDQL
jgi:hypothetical protein